MHYFGCDSMPGSEKIAAFDMDQCLIEPKSGAKFPKTRGDWKWLYTTIPEKLKQLHQEGVKVRGRLLFSESLACFGSLCSPWFVNVFTRSSCVLVWCGFCPLCSCVTLCTQRFVSYAFVVVAESSVAHFLIYGQAMTSRFRFVFRAMLLLHHSLQIDFCERVSSHFVLPFAFLAMAFTCYVSALPNRTLPHALQSPSPFLPISRSSSSPIKEE